MLDIVDLVVRAGGQKAKVHNGKFTDSTSSLIYVEKYKIKVRQKCPCNVIPVPFLLQTAICIVIAVVICGGNHRTHLRAEPARMAVIY